MCKYAFCKDFTKLNTFLVETVQIPYKALEHDLVLKVSKKCTKGRRSKLLTCDDAGRTAAFKVFVQVLVLFAACKSNDLCSYIGTELLLACAVLNVNINTKLALFESDKLKRYDIGSLMEKLIEGMLSVCSWFSEDHRTCDLR